MESSLRVLQALVTARHARLSSWTGTGPERVEISRPLDGYEAAFTFDRVEKNVPVPERAFQPRTPPEYTVVEVGR